MVDLSDRCIHDMARELCGLCRTEAAREDVRRLGPVRMSARFESACPGCGETISEGDMIVKADDGQFVCGWCGESR